MRLEDMQSKSVTLMKEAQTAWLVGVQGCALQIDEYKRKCCP